MSGLPQVRLGPLSVSRLVCGSNPFFGYSYRSPAHDRWQRRTFTPQRISEVLEKCLEVGINTVACNCDGERTMPQARDRLDEVIEWLALIRERGMVAGLGCHQAHVIREAERRGYDVDFYTTTLNSLRVYCDYHNAALAINEIDKPVLAVKARAVAPEPQVGAARL